MANLDEIVEFLEGELRTSEVPDYEGAYNGLQLQNEGRVTKVAAAVDASLPVIEKAIAADADLLVVHHGMFWQGVRSFVGPTYHKIKKAMDHGLAIYSSHIPLDIHPTWGNNILLAEALGFDETAPFFDWKGIMLGRSVNSDQTLAELEGRLSAVLGGPVLVQGAKEGEVGRVGIITGGAGSEVEAIAAQGINTFVTGEGPHWSAPLAEEAGVNLLYGGHYATETFGVKKVAAEVGRFFEVPWVFLDHPTHL
ncbi:Nif3-like dinuclear metal center hexameric protein [Akkermansiaceae bacterium]|nr:Nif3-like dinuclear metal center hexameric protein [Akkermansiaceae bacterium]MDB4283865.1 Nif3-like dinuclear metal center hexameric protein [Akkermansiaceae bacterium]MDB4781870.1 Nif3-like dinuclear metal center hexameric protein [Akkermansiaceae bacterium]MDC0275216.1 Nif3-like dinuclear metal center hexameric protein [Akkermansiaceae bacterium]